MIMKREEFIIGMQFGNLFYRRYCRIKKTKLDEGEWMDLLGIINLDVLTYSELENVYYNTYLKKLHEK